MKRMLPKIIFSILIIALLILAGLLTLAYRQVALAQTEAMEPTTAPAELDDPLALTVMTINLAGKPLFDADRYERYRALGAVIMIHDPDIVVLQEAADERERERLVEELAYSRLQHAAYFQSSVWGSGLFVLSAFPVADTAYHRYDANTPWYALRQPDWWLGKGTGLARLEIAPQRYLDCYVFHLDARHTMAGAALRERQWRETLDFLGNSLDPAVPALLLGDTTAPVTDFSVVADNNQGIRLELLFEDSTESTALYWIGHSTEYTHDVLDAHSQEATFVKNQETLRLSASNLYWATLKITPTP